MYTRFARFVDSQLAWVTVFVAVGPFGLWALRLQVWLQRHDWWPVDHPSVE